LVSYLAACATYADPADGALVRGFLEFVLSDQGQQAAAANAGSSPIGTDPALLAKAVAAVGAIR
jgi:phosphate transport system substrate-binding protein